MLSFFFRSCVVSAGEQTFIFFPLQGFSQAEDNTLEKRSGPQKVSRHATDEEGMMGNELHRPMEPGPDFQSPQLQEADPGDHLFPQTSLKLVSIDDAEIPGDSKRRIGYGSESTTVYEQDAEDNDKSYDDDDVGDDEGAAGFPENHLVSKRYVDVQTSTNKDSETSPLVLVELDKSSRKTKELIANLLKSYMPAASKDKAVSSSRIPGQRRKTIKKRFRRQRPTVGVNKANDEPRWKELVKQLMDKVIKKRQELFSRQISDLRHVVKRVKREAAEDGGSLDSLEDLIGQLRHVEGVKRRNRVIKALMADPLHPANVADGILKVTRFAEALRSEIWLLPQSPMRDALARVGVAVLALLPSGDDLQSDNKHSALISKNSGLRRRRKRSYVLNGSPSGFEYRPSLHKRLLKLQKNVNGRDWQFHQLQASMGQEEELDVVYPDFDLLKQKQLIQKQIDALTNVLHQIRSTESLSNDHKLGVLPPLLSNMKATYETTSGAGSLSRSKRSASDTDLPMFTTEVPKRTVARLIQDALQDSPSEVDSREVRSPAEVAEFEPQDLTENSVDGSTSADQQQEEFENNQQAEKFYTMANMMQGFKSLVDKAYEGMNDAYEKFLGSLAGLYDNQGGRTIGISTFIISYEHSC